MANRWGKNGNSDGFYFLGLQNHWTVTEAMKLKEACSLEGKLWKPSQHIKQQRHHFADKGPSSQSYGFSSNHVWMWELDYNEGWALKNWCLWIVVLEMTLKSPLECKEIKLVNPKEYPPWIFIGRTDAKAPILRPSDAKHRLIGKDWCCGKTEGRRRRGQRGWDG